jgi:hypothetical protein
MNTLRSLRYDRKLRFAFCVDEIREKCKGEVAHLVEESRSVWQRVTGAQALRLPPGLSPNGRCSPQTHIQDFLREFKSRKLKLAENIDSDPGWVVKCTSMDGALYVPHTLILQPLNGPAIALAPAMIQPQNAALCHFHMAHNTLLINRTNNNDAVVQVTLLCELLLHAER